jgi:hypothetical protein
MLRNGIFNTIEWFNSHFEPHAPKWHFEELGHGGIVPTQCCRDRVAFEFCCSSLYIVEVSKGIGKENGNAAPVSEPFRHSGASAECLSVRFIDSLKYDPSLYIVMVCKAAKNKMGMLTLCRKRSDTVVL